MITKSRTSKIGLMAELRVESIVTVMAILKETALVTIMEVLAVMA